MQQIVMSLNSFPFVKTMCCSGVTWWDFLMMCIFLVLFCTVVFALQNLYNLKLFFICLRTVWMKNTDHAKICKITKTCIFLDILKKTGIRPPMFFLGKIIYLEAGSAINPCCWTWVDPRCEGKPLEHILSAQEGSPANTWWNRDGLSVYLILSVPTEDVPLSTCPPAHVYLICS